MRSESFPIGFRLRLKMASSYWGQLLPVCTRFIGCSSRDELPVANYRTAGVDCGGKKYRCYNVSNSTVINNWASDCTLPSAYFFFHPHFPPYFPPPPPPPPVPSSHSTSPRAPRYPVSSSSLVPFSSPLATLEELCGGGARWGIGGEGEEGGIKSKGEWGVFLIPHLAPPPHSSSNPFRILLSLSSSSTYIVRFTNTTTLQYLPNHHFFLLLLFLLLKTLFYIGNIHQIIHLPTPSIHPFIHPATHLSSHRWLHPSLPSIPPPIHPFIRPSVRPFIHQVIHPGIHLILPFSLSE